MLNCSLKHSWKSTKLSQCFIIYWIEPLYGGHSNSKVKLGPFHSRTIMFFHRGIQSICSVVVSWTVQFNLPINSQRNSIMFWWHYKIHIFTPVTNNFGHNCPYAWSWVEVGTDPQKNPPSLVSPNVKSKDLYVYVNNLVWHWCIRKLTSCAFSKPSQKLHLVKLCNKGWILP